MGLGLFLDTPTKRWAALVIAAVLGSAISLFLDVRSVGLILLAVAGTLGLVEFVQARFGNRVGGATRGILILGLGLYVLAGRSEDLGLVALAVILAAGAWPARVEVRATVVHPVTANCSENSKRRLLVGWLVLLPVIAIVWLAFMRVLLEYWPGTL